MRVYFSGVKGVNCIHFSADFLWVLKWIMFRVICSEIYKIIDNFVCLGYFCLLKVRLSKHDTSFRNTRLDDLYGFNTMVTHEYLVISCNCKKSSNNCIIDMSQWKFWLLPIKMDYCCWFRCSGIKPNSKICSGLYQYYQQTL